MLSRSWRLVARVEVAIVERETRNAGKLKGFGAGAGAALIMQVVMLLLRLTTNTHSLPELMEDRLTHLLGGELESSVIDKLGIGGKGLLLVSIVEGTFLVGGLLGWLFVRLWPLRQPGAKTRWGSALLLGLGLGLLLNVVFLPLMGQGLFGTDAPLETAPLEIARQLYGTVLAPVGLSDWLYMWILGSVFSFALVALLPWARFADAVPADQAKAMDTDKAGGHKPTRRDFGKVAGSTALALVGGGGVWLLNNMLLAPPPVAGAKPVAAGGGGASGAGGDATFAGVAPRQVPNITPVENFYITTKNYIDPVVNGNTWSLAIKGLVAHPSTLSLADLRALPTVERTETLACVSNPVGAT